MADAQRTGKYILSIDLGTGGPKVGLVDQVGQVAASAYAPVQTFYLAEGAVEHDPTEWWSSISTCVGKVLKSPGISPEAIIAIAVTSNWSLTLPVEKAGLPLMRAMSWMDGRGSPYNREVVKGFPNVQGYKLSTLFKYINLSGFPPTLTGSDDLGHMLYIKNKLPDIYKQTYKFMEPMDYINMRLTGKFAATQNTAIATFMVDNRRLDSLEYDPWLTKKGGIDREKLSDLMPIDGILGTITPAIANEWGLSPKTVVTCGVNDNSTSAVGAGAIDDGEAAAVLGTSGHLAAHVPFKKTDIFNSIVTMPSGIKDRYLLVGELANTGNVLNNYLKNMVYAEDAFETGIIPVNLYERATRVASSVPPGSGGVLFLPWFNGILSPGEDPLMRGGFLNLSPGTSRAHLTRAVFEGIAMNWRWLRRPAEKLVGKPFKFWRLTGGGALSDVWAQIMADVVGIPMHRQADPRNNNVIGMGLLAFNRLNMIRLDEIPHLVKFDRIFEPDPKNQVIYDEVFEQFLAAKDKVRPVIHALNKP
jgi:xylulokinase